MIKILKIRYTDKNSEKLGTMIIIQKIKYNNKMIWNSRAADQERARGAEFIEDRKIAKDKVSYMDVPQRPVSVSSAGSDSKWGQKFFFTDKLYSTPRWWNLK